MATKSLMGFAGALHWRELCSCVLRGDVQMNLPPCTVISAVIYLPEKNSALGYRLQYSSAGKLASSPCRLSFFSWGR